VTRLGWGALCAGLVLLGVGLGASWPPLLALGAGLVVLSVGALAYVLRAPRFDLERAVEPPRVEKRRPAIAVVRATNLSRRTLAPVPIEQRLGTTVFRAELPRMRKGEQGLRTYRLPTSRRGTYEVGPVEVPRADPFGLCRRARALGQPQVISVHPRVLPLRPITSGTSRNVEGPSSDMSPQGSVTFHRLREYVIGDDLRKVHWPSTARLGKLVVRQYVDTAQPYTVVLVDLRPEVYSPDSFEEALDVTASVVMSMALGEAPVQLRTTTGDRVGGTRKSNPDAIVDYLTDLAPSSEGSLSGQLVDLRRERGGNAVVVVTGVVQQDSLPEVAALRRRFDHVILTALVPRPTPAPAYPGLTILVGTDADEVAQGWEAQVAK
jgi:uncharacterized protein (DUF58 family)